MIIYIYTRQNREALIQTPVIRGTIARDAATVARINALWGRDERVSNTIFTPRAFQLERVS